MPTIQADSVRYIKLGQRGSWEKECIENKKKIIRLGFDTHLYVDHFLSNGDWENALDSHFSDKSKGTITSIKNQVRFFFKDDGHTLWITFYDRKMWWTFIDPTQPAQLAKTLVNYDGTFRNTTDSLQSNDINGIPLHMSSLSGRVTQMASFRGTSFEVGKDEKDYILRRINGDSEPSAAEARILCEELKRVVIKMMCQLTPKDFELLVDLVFTTSGWLRLGSVGGVQKTIDMEIVLPTTGQRAFIQVKSKTDQNEFNEYLEAFQQMSQTGRMGRMFYVFHSYKESGGITCEDNNVTIIDSKPLAEMVLEAGLVAWLIEKVS